MQFTFKFILLAIALVYGGTAVSAIPVPVRESTVAARSVAYDDLNTRDVELFVRNHLVKKVAKVIGHALKSLKKVFKRPQRVSPLATLNFFNCLTKCFFVTGQAESCNKSIGNSKNINYLTECFLVIGRRSFR
jgi:hypothetical protein